MNEILFYFKIKDLKNILKFTDILNKTFEKYFWLKYDWLARNDVEKLISYDYIVINNMNYSWPYNSAFTFEDNFFIGLSFLEKNFIDKNNIFKDGFFRLTKDFTKEELKNLKIKFVNEIYENLPVYWIISIKNNEAKEFYYDFHKNKINNLNYDFIAFKENNILKFI